MAMAAKRSFVEQEDFIPFKSDEPPVVAKHEEPPVVAKRKREVGQDEDDGVAADKPAGLKKLKANKKTRKEKEKERNEERKKRKEKKKKRDHDIVVVQDKEPKKSSSHSTRSTLPQGQGCLAAPWQCRRYSDVPSIGYARLP